jgi:hypothetical protein
MCKSKLLSEFSRLGIDNPQVEFIKERNKIHIGYSKHEIEGMGFDIDLFKSSQKTIFEGLDNHPRATGVISPMGIMANRPDLYWQERKYLSMESEIFFDTLKIIPQKKSIPFNILDRTPQAALLSLVKVNNGACIGEIHHDISPKKLLIESMNRLKREGVTTIFIEHLLYDHHQAELDSLHAKKQFKPSKELEAYLTAMDHGHMKKHESEIISNFGYTAMIKSAIQANIRVVAVDTEVSYTSFQEGLNSHKKQQDRYKTMNYQVNKIIDTEKGQGKWIAFVGSAHSTTCKEIPGISELLDVPSIVVEDVRQNKKTGIVLHPKDHAQGQIKPDMVIIIDPLEKNQNKNINLVKRVKKNISEIFKGRTF